MMLVTHCSTLVCYRARSIWGQGSCRSNFFWQPRKKVRSANSHLQVNRIFDLDTDPTWLCIPFWIPIVLWIQRRLGLRDHDDPPQTHEVVIPLLVIAFVFEVVLPSTQTWSGLAVPDPGDVVCYAAGALASVGCWTWFYRTAETATMIVNDDG